MRRVWPFNMRKRTRIKRGVLIPQSVQVRPTRTLMIRPITALLPVTGIGCLLFFSLQYVAESRLTQVATPAIVYSQSEPYQNQVIVEGPNADFNDEVIFSGVTDTAIAEYPTVVVVSRPENTVTLYKDAQPVLVATITAWADDALWRSLLSGYYTVATIESERYSSLSQRYYPNAIVLSSQNMIHGVGYRNRGDYTPAPSLGAQVQTSDSAALAALVTPGTPVLIHAPTEALLSGAPTLVATGPAIAARSYIVYDNTAEAVLVQREPSLVVPIASLTKLMTALVVAETYDLEGEVLIDQEKYVTTLVSRLPDTPRSSIFDLLQLLLLESSNEAAEVLATVVGRDVFIAEMNETAARLALTDTYFTDPSGLDDTNVSSANDLLTLTQYIAERHPYILSISTAEGLLAAARDNDFSDLENFNEVEELTNFTGGKIGETAAALQTSVTRHTLTVAGRARDIMIVVLGTEERDEQVRLLSAYITEQFTE